MPKRGKPTKRPPRKLPEGGDAPKKRRSARERVSSLRHHERGPSDHEPGPLAELLQMMGIVAVVVIVVILIFFALGYAFGRYFL